MDEQILLASEVARKVGRSAQCIRSLADRQLLPCIRTERGTRLFKLSDVVELGERLHAQKAREDATVS